MKDLTPFEFVWLLRILQNNDTWQQTRIASRFVFRILTTQRKANGKQLYILKYNMLSPYKKLLENELLK